MLPFVLPAVVGPFWAAAAAAAAKAAIVWRLFLFWDEEEDDDDLEELDVVDEAHDVEEAFEFGPATLRPPAVDDEADDDDEGDINEPAFY